MASRRIPIGQYGLIGDTRSAALVAPDGAIDWCCLPRFDSAPVFGRLVGGPEAGWFSVGPAEPASPPTRSYRDGATTLTTRWQLDGGEVELADTMVAIVSGRLLPATLLVRQVTARGRAARVALQVVPRFGDRRSPARRTMHRQDALVFEHDDLAIAVAADADHLLLPDEPVEVVVDPARPLTVALTAAHRGPLVFVPPRRAASEAARDELGWRRWSADIVSTPAHRDVVIRSLLTLQLLTYSPSGAPVAAPTTSLPEVLGGSRNWDYRYAWPRDASIGVAAFLVAGKHREAPAFLAWLLHASRVARPWLPALFTLDGRPGPRERMLQDWPGYADSRPVRVGNGAAGQHQLDGYGWVLDAAWHYAHAGHQLSGEMWRAITRFADHVERTWPLPDAGIWERRDAPRHHVHSKLMAWLALDRAARIAALRGGRRATQRRQRWTAACDRIAADVRRHGFDSTLGVYTAAYGSSDLDAAVLLLPAIGMEPNDSPRVSATIDAIRTKLGTGGPLLYRYLGDDGLPGAEGAFLPCSFWLVQALAHVGRHDEASELFDELLGIAGPLGLFAEEVEPETGEQIGNFPQALSHAALLQAALALQP